MKSKVFKRILSAILSIQMICAFTPAIVLNANAEELQMYLNEDFTSENNKWTGKTENMGILTDEEIPYMRYTAADTEQKITRKVDNTLPGGSVYVAEFDIRFADANSGVVELYGGSQLGPTVIFDGEKIKTKYGNPSSYDTMYQGVEVNKWYNVKFLANGTTSMVGYTKAAGTDEEAQATKSEKVIRNLKNTIFSKFNVTNKVNGESDIRSGAVDVRNMKVYKPAPTEVTIGVTDDISKVSIPAEGTTKTVNYLVAAALFNGIDLSSYEPLSKELVKFELYNSDDTESLQENLPTGITLNPATGVLTVSSEADAGEYNVRLLSYDGAVYDSKKITIAQAGLAASVSLINPAEKLPIPNNGTVSTEFFAQCYDKAGSEAYGIPLKWSLLNADETELNDSGISIDENTGVISSTSSAAASSFKVKVALKDNPNVYEISEEIETYKMTASKIDIIGADMLQTASQVSETYTIKIFDQYGAEMPSEELSGWNAENTTDGITFENGVLTAAANSDSDVIIKATSGDITASKTVRVYKPVLSEIAVDGDMSIEIPKSGNKSFTYTAKAYDQKGIEIKDTDFSWSMEAYDNNGITFDSAKAMITADGAATEQTITVTASTADINGSLKVVVTKNPFTYKPVDGGFEIDNGNKNYTRPIYAAHTNDNGETSFRYIYYLGDRPKLVLSNAGTGTSFFRFAHMFLGIKDGKWLDEMSNITARYVNGHEEYVIKDSSFEGEIKLTYTRSDKIDAMLVKAELPDSVKDKLVVAAAGGNRIDSKQPTGGNSSALEFSPSDTNSTVPTFTDNSFSITGSYATISGTSNVKMNYAAKDSSMYSSGVDALLTSTAANQPMVVGTTDGNTENTVYMMITTDSPSENKYFNEYQTNAREIFNDSVNYFKGVAETIKIDTPDPYINSAMRAQVMAMDNIWDNPVITHGAIGWHNGQGGWRGGYCFVNAGWSDRIKTNIQNYIARQEKDTGRIWAYPSHDGRYNMSLVMVDIIMQYWDWTGDDAFFSEEGGYDFIAGHLKFMDDYMQVPGTNLYENWLDAWNTDNKWNNGGTGSIATAYTWRAYNTMAKIAAKLGKTDDAAAYQTKADLIKKEMNEQLWNADTGVFGEVKERFGYGRLNTAPDLSSIYTPVDMGIATDEQVYQMMRFTDYAVPSVANLDKIWDNIDFKYSSNRLPEYYSSDGLYVEEVMNNALAYFENGQREMGMKQFRACLVPLMKGSSAGQGTVQHIVKADLSNNGHIDFADCTSQYARTAAEGIFGIKVNVPDSKADIKPGFPADWKYASIKMDAVSYDYKYENNTDKFSVTSKENLSYEMHVPTRSSKITSVKVNGTEVTDYTVDNFVNVKTPVGNSAVVEVTYANDEIAKVETEAVGGKNSDYTVKSNGKITAISDPQSLITNTDGIGTDTITVKLGEKSGHHTFFVTVEKNDMTAVLPVDLEIKDAVELTDMEIVTGANAGIKVKLTNNTEKQLTLNAVLSTVSGKVTEENITIAAKGASNEILVPIENETDLTPGNNKVTAVLSGDIDNTIYGEITAWDLKDTVTNTAEQYQTISLDGVVNQDLRTLHQNTYDLTYEGNEHYRLERFYWSSDAERTVLPNGRAWWEPNRGTNGVPSSLNLPSSGGEYTTNIGVPFKISSSEGNNAAFVSLYNQFPDKMNIPVNTDGSKIYFMLSVSTNNMQSRIENARITVNMKDGTKEILPLTNPDNIDDWLNYQQSKPYAETGYVQMLGDKAHSNILALDFGKVNQIESVDFECLSSEVLAGLLGITVVKGEFEEPFSVGEIEFDKTELTAGETVTATSAIKNNGETDIPVNMMIALYDENGTLKELKTEKHTVTANSANEYSITYSNSAIESGDYIKAFLWNSLENMKPLTEAKILR